MMAVINTMIYEESYNKSFIYRIFAYLILMLFGVMLRTFVTGSVAIVWIINIIGLLVCFFPIYRRLSQKVLFYSIFYIILCLITFLLNVGYFNESLKSIGTNINIIIVPMYLFIISYVSKHKPFDNVNLFKLLRLISLLGTVSVLFAWIFDFQDIIRIILGQVRVYSADVDGFFYHKNIYGAFITLSLAADLFLYSTVRKRSRLIVLIAKLFAIVLSLSRAALLQAGIMLFVFFWTEKKHRINDVLLLLIIVAVIAVVLLTNDSILYFIRNSILRVDVGDAGRAHLRLRALEIVGSNYLNFLFGVGFSGLDFLDVDIDNTYLYLLFTGGIVKVIFFVFYYFLATKRNIEIKQYNRLVYRLSISVSVSYLAYAFFESVAVLELGLLNFCNMFYIFLLPFGYNPAKKPLINS